MRHLPLLRERQKSFSLDWLCKLIIGPIVTEKAYMNANYKIYTVSVHSDATKVSIRAAFEKLFEIKPISINILTLKGKRKNRRIKGGAGQITITRPNIKKAMIKLPADAKFDFANG